ncbi:MAG: hypothetical protein PHD02_01665 [Bacilli bacterium]|nr:hypothetical protein [Bacilli bacterium]
MKCINKFCYIIFFVSTLFLPISIAKAVSIENTGVCSITSVYSDSTDVENAIGSSAYLDASMGNSKYCPVYCVEENIFTWPGFKVTTEVGEHFSWTVGETVEANIISGLTVQLNGKRDCRTDIDLNRWMNDYNDLLNNIATEEAKLVKNPSYNTICLPQKGSRGCGYISLGGFSIGHENISPAAFVGMDNNQGASVNGMSITTAGIASDIHSNKYLTITTISGMSANSDGTLNYTTTVESRKYNCPCDWEDTNVISTPVTLATATYTPGTEAFGLATSCIGGSGERIAMNSANVQGLSLESWKCSAHAELEEKTSYTTVCKCTIDGTTYSGFSTGECRAEGGTFAGCTTTSHTYYVPTGNVVVDSIQQELCDVDWEEYKLGSDCHTYGPYCPDGYYLGLDNYDNAKCYKKDTSYLQSLLDYQETMINILDNCSKLSIDYELNTDMTVSFEEPTYGRDVVLNSEETLSEEKENHKVYGDEVATGGTKTVVKRVCHLSGLRKYCDSYYSHTENISSIWISEYGKEYDVSYDYMLPANFYRYVSLPSGVSSDTKSSYNDSTFGTYTNFIDVGYANYPVNYSTSTGTYNLDILYSNIGYKDHFTQYITTNINSDTKVVTYDCEYDVEDDKLVVEDDTEEFGGIRLIYRPISLSNPFPGFDAEGRLTGSNWCDGDNCAGDETNSLVEKYILNNRNTETESVYDKEEPMYQITLTPSLINQIRDYNETHSYDDYDLYCVDGKDCQSEFIKVTFQGAFEGCGVSSDFDYCDSLDEYTRGDES